MPDLVLTPKIDMAKKNWHAAVEGDIHGKNIQAGKVIGIIPEGLNYDTTGGPEPFIVFNDTGKNDIKYDIIGGVNPYVVFKETSTNNTAIDHDVQGRVVDSLQSIVVDDDARFLSSLSKTKQVFDNPVDESSRNNLRDSIIEILQEFIHCTHNMRDSSKVNNLKTDIALQHITYILKKYDQIQSCTATGKIDDKTISQSKKITIERSTNVNMTEDNSGINPVTNPDLGDDH